MSIMHRDAIMRLMVEVENGFAAFADEQPGNLPYRRLQRKLPSAQNAPALVTSGPLLPLIRTGSSPGLFRRENAIDLTDILDQRNRDYCIAELLSR